MSIDHGELNVPLAKRYGRGGIDAAIDRHLAEQGRQAAVKHKAGIAAAREREAARVRLTREQVEGARYVRDEFGWHEVVRVSAKSVTVKTPYSWTDRISLDKLREVRA